jgi:hypothetical protein
MSEVDAALLTALILDAVIGAWLSIKLQRSVGLCSPAAEKALGLDRSGAVPTQYARYLYNAFFSPEVSLLPDNLRKTVRAYAACKITGLVLFLSVVHSFFLA